MLKWVSPLPWHKWWDQSINGNSITWSHTRKMMVSFILHNKSPTLKIKNSRLLSCAKFENHITSNSINIHWLPTKYWAWGCKWALNLCLPVRRAWVYMEGALHCLESTVVLITLITNVFVAYKTHQVVAPLGWPSWVLLTLPALASLSEHWHFVGWTFLFFPKGLAWACFQAVVETQGGKPNSFLGVFLKACFCHICWLCLG